MRPPKGLLLMTDTQNDLPLTNGAEEPRLDPRTDEMTSAQTSAPAPLGGLPDRLADTENPNERDTVEPTRETLTQEENPYTQGVTKRTIRMKIVRATQPSPFKELCPVCTEEQVTYREQLTLKMDTYLAMLHASVRCGACNSVIGGSVCALHPGVDGGRPFEISAGPFRVPPPRRPRPMGKA